MSADVIDSTYMPFTAEELKSHFLSQPAEQDKIIKYYMDSASRYRNRASAVTWNAIRLARQIEKDERFWLAATLLKYWRLDPASRTAKLAELMRRAFPGCVPPFPGFATWEDALSGNLCLNFEVQLHSPAAYRLWLSEHLDTRQFIPYLIETGQVQGGSQPAHPFRTDLEGPTHVDALIINETTHVAIAIEAKVLSDTSYQVTYDPVRNQLIRNIDVLLEQPHKGDQRPLVSRDACRTVFVLLTPRLFKRMPHTRLYGHLMEHYMASDLALHRDLPHRADEDLTAIPRRIGWLTWEDCKSVLPDAAPWLDIAACEINEEAVLP